MNHNLIASEQAYFQWVNLWNIDYGGTAQLFCGEQFVWPWYEISKTIHYTYNENNVVNALEKYGRFVHEVFVDVNMSLVSCSFQCWNAGVYPKGPLCCMIMRIFQEDIRITLILTSLICKEAFETLWNLKDHTLFHGSHASFEQYVNVKVWYVSMALKVQGR